MGLSYLLVGGKVILSAGASFSVPWIFDLDAFFDDYCLAGAIYLGEYSEAITVMFLYELGQLLEHRSVDKSRRAIQSILAQKPEIAHLLEDGRIIEQRDAESLDRRLAHRCVPRADSSGRQGGKG